MHLIETALCNKLFNILAKLHVYTCTCTCTRQAAIGLQAPVWNMTLHCTQDFTFYAIKHFLNSINPKVLLKYQEVLILSI